MIVSIFYKFEENNNNYGSSGLKRLGLQQMFNEFALFVFGYSLSIP